MGLGSVEVSSPIQRNTSKDPFEAGGSGNKAARRRFWLWLVAACCQFVSTFRMEEETEWQHLAASALTK